MKHQVKLPERISSVLREWPEDGMGYQLVDLILKNGRIIKGQVVLDSSLWSTDMDVESNMVESVRKGSRNNAA
jgi:hypothetical protein